MGHAVSRECVFGAESEEGEELTCGTDVSCAASSPRFAPMTRRIHLPGAGRDAATDRVTARAVALRIAGGALQVAGASGRASSIGSGLTCRVWR